MAKISHSPYLRLISSIFGTIFLGFGINGVLRPHNAFEVFKLTYPISPDDQKVVDSLILLYSMKEFFSAFAIYATAWYGNRKALGLITIVGSFCAFGDGVICKMAGTGSEWDHWGYAPVMTVIGGLLMGVLDGA